MSSKQITKVNKSNCFKIIVQRIVNEIVRKRTSCFICSAWFNTYDVFSVYGGQNKMKETEEKFLYLLTFGVGMIGGAFIVGLYVSYQIMKNGCVCWW